VVTQSETGECFGGKQCSCFWKEALLRLVVLRRLSKLTRASSVGESITGDIPRRVSGCLAGSNESGDTFLVPVKQGTTFSKLVCRNCGRTGHIATKCYLKDNRDARVNKLGSETQGRTTKFQGARRGDVKCYNCGEGGTWLGTVRSLGSLEDMGH
jgi:DNA-directed RNA polymerase subunit M/transcription elongation factor TFIIS